MQTMSSIRLVQLGSWSLIAACVLAAGVWGCGHDAASAGPGQPSGNGAMGGAAAVGGAATSGGATASGGAGSGAGGSGGAASGGGGGTGGVPVVEPSPRTRSLITDGWRFQKDDPAGTTGLDYATAKTWVLPSGNAFLTDPSERAVRPSGNLGDGVSFVTAEFDDTSWLSVDLPHDYAIAGPFTNSISSSMGRLPSIGVAWYRKKVADSGDRGRKVGCSWISTAPCPTAWSG